MSERLKTAYHSQLHGMLPKAALIMFSTLDNGYGSSHYFEIANFEHTAKGYRMLPGRPLTKEVANDLADSLSDGGSTNLRPKPGTMIPKNVLFYTSGAKPQVTWVAKEQTRSAMFDPNLNIQARAIRYPHLLFSVQNFQLSVYAVKEEFPQLSDKLYVVPLPNIHGDCRVCLGSAAPRNSFEFLQDFMLGYEKAFFASEFNMYHGVENYYSGMNVNLFWKRMEKASAFDYSILKPYKKFTVKSILND
jgi:PRTRC genetic system protein B